MDLPTTTQSLNSSADDMIVIRPAGQGAQIDVIALVLNWTKPKDLAFTAGKRHLLSRNPDAIAYMRRWFLHSKFSKEDGGPWNQIYIKFSVR